VATHVDRTVETRNRNFCVEVTEKLFSMRRKRREYCIIRVRS